MESEGKKLGFIISCLQVGNLSDHFMPANSYVFTLSCYNCAFKTTDSEILTGLVDLEYAPSEQDEHYDAPSSKVSQLAMLEVIQMNQSC